MASFAPNRDSPCLLGGGCAAASSSSADAAGVAPSSSSSYSSYSSDSSYSSYSSYSSSSSARCPASSSSSSPPTLRKFAAPASLPRSQPSSTSFPSGGPFPPKGCRRRRRGRGPLAAVAIVLASAQLYFGSLGSWRGWQPSGLSGDEQPQASRLPGHKAFVPSSRSPPGLVQTSSWLASSSSVAGPLPSAATASSSSIALTSSRSFYDLSSSSSSSSSSVATPAPPPPSLRSAPTTSTSFSAAKLFLMARTASPPASAERTAAKPFLMAKTASPPAVAPGRTSGLAAAPGSKVGSVAFQDGSSLLQSTLNLLKNIIGSGMLSLPAGVAAFSSDPRAVVPACAATLLMAALSAYGFILLGDACSTTGEKTYQGAWGKALSRSTSFIPAIACTAKAAIACVGFAMIMGDCFSMVVGCSRTAAIVGLASTVLFPLCCLKSLKPLSKFSALGVLSNFYVCFFILLRYLDGTYASSLAATATAAAGSSMSAGSVWGLALNPGFITMASILSTSYLAHYNAPTFYDQLAADEEGNKDARFRLMSVVGFSLAGLAFCLLLCGGFWTFGEASTGLILNNYAPEDRLAILARLAMVVGMVTGYPLTFMGLRKQCLALFAPSGEKPQEEPSLALTVALLVPLTAAAVSLTDLGKLVAIAGACFGSFLIYIAPALMVLGSKRKGLRPRGSVLETVVQHLMVPLGLCLGVAGVLQALK